MADGPFDQVRSEGKRVRRFHEAGKRYVIHSDSAAFLFCFKESPRQGASALSVYPFRHVDTAASVIRDCSAPLRACKWALGPLQPNRCDTRPATIPWIMTATGPQNQHPMPVARSKSLPAFATHDIERDGVPFQPPSDEHEHDVRLEVEEERVAVNLWHRFRGDCRQTPMPSLWQSVIGLRGSNVINVLLITVPIAWVSHYAHNDDGSHYFSARTRLARASLVACRRRRLTPAQSTSSRSSRFRSGSSGWARK